MKKVNYPAIFHKENKGYWIEFPDVPGAYSQAKNFDEAISMATDALALALDDIERSGKELPKPSRADKIKLDSDSTMAFIVFDLDAQRKNIKYYRSVKKTLSIPYWLNEAATEAGINFSAILQKALKAELGL